MFIPKKIYKMLVESRDAWRGLAERIQQDNKGIVRVAKDVNDSNKTLLDYLQNVKKKLAKELIADIEEILEVDENGEAKFDIRELFKIEKKYTEASE